MAKRVKKPLIQAPSRDEAQQLMHAYAKAQSQLKKLEAEIELQVQNIRKKHESTIAQLKSDQGSYFEQLQAYAEENREAEFNKKKSQEWAHGLIGFRTSPPKVATRKGFTWKVAQELIERFELPFLRTKVEPDKEKIVASRDDIDMMEKLYDCGVEVVQEESFFIEVKEENIA